MAAQQGFEYEKNAAKVLKKHGIVPVNFIPAGAGHNQPDLMLQYKAKKAGCELKISAASAGSLVLKFDVKKQKDQWGFGDIKQDEDEKKFLASVAEKTGFFKDVQKMWGNRTPQKFMNPPAIKDSHKRYEFDLEHFADIKKTIPATVIEDYYVKKNTFYVNIGTHGFYLMGTRNPLGLLNVPRFGSSAIATTRGRVQYKGSGNYQFTFELQFSVKMKSPFNIAPIKKTSVVILEKELVLTPFGI